MNKWTKRLIIGVIALVLVGAGAILVYTQFIADPDPELTTDDLSERVSGTDSEGSSADTDESSSETTPQEPDATEPEASDPAAAEPDTSDEPPGSDAGAGIEGLDGLYSPTTDSVFGYRVDEELAGVNVTATGRSSEIDGSLEIEGTTATVDISVLVENITSDESRRDSQFKGRIMEASDFPEAAFVTTEPIDFGTIPPDGEQITATVNGEVTLKGVTNAVSFEVTAEVNGDRIGVLGNIPVVFADYGIANPSFGAVKTEDEGLIEFVLVFEPA